MKKILLLFLFMFITPINLGISLFCLDHIVKPYYQEPFFSTTPTQLYASLPDESRGEVLGITTFADARPVIIQKYLEGYHSPLLPYANLIVTTSDKYGVDWRLLIAIAQQESNLGKKIPEGSYNAWGWGIHSQGTLGFSSWEEAIETVAQGIKEGYLDKGYKTPEEIMKKYTPNSDGSWSFAVNHFLEELELGKID